MKRKPNLNPTDLQDSESLLSKEQKSLVRSRTPIDKCRYEDEEVRWLTVIRSRVWKAGSKPTEKLLWVGFLD